MANPTLSEKIRRRFFSSHLMESDPELFGAINSELLRQQNQLEMIASENIVSLAVLEAQGSWLTNKYAEGYPGKRYYGGCEYVDVAETLAINRAKKLFNCTYVNVQPHSGCQANQAVFLALLQPGDTILGMSLAAGGHLTHGSKPSLSGKWFNAINYGVRPDDFVIDYEEVSRLAEQHRPKLIIAGGSAYPLIIDFAKFRQIADSVGAYLMVDMAHFAGLVAGNVYPNPLPFAHVVTTTTHKTLRGPRGGMILSNDEELGAKINSAVFPGLQGGPLMHIIAAKAVAFREALQPCFQEYAASVVENAKVLVYALKKRGLQIVGGKTESHMLLMDLRPQGLTGNIIEKSLEKAGLTSNKNSIPFDTTPPMITSGIRLGTPAITTRGLTTLECETIANSIATVIEAHDKQQNIEHVEVQVLKTSLSLCERFPIYPEMNSSF
jgi:glycine hydroxymethyltransferase